MATVGIKLGAVNIEDATTRIVSTFHAATPAELTNGLVWYPFFGEKIALFGAAYGLNADSARALFACLSTGTSVQHNWLNFTRACIAGNASTLTACYPVMKIKVDLYLRGACDIATIISGQKVTSFYRNLSGNVADYVTIDRHAAAVCYGFSSGDMKISDKQYRDCAQAFKDAARILDITPAACQAVVWVVWRRLKGIKDAGGNADINAMVDEETSRAIVRKRNGESGIRCGNITASRRAASRSGIARLKILHSQLG